MKNSTLRCLFSSLFLQFCFFLSFFCGIWKKRWNSATQKLRHLMTEKGIDRFLCGGIIGLGVGDMIGFQMEGNPPQVCSRLVSLLYQLSGKREKRENQRLPSGEIKEEIPLEFQSGYFPFGQYSDDTQLTRELVSAVYHSFLQEQTIHDVGKSEKNIQRKAERVTFSYAERISFLYQKHLIIGCGFATSKALSRLLQGVDYKEAASPIGMAGNSPSVRAVAAYLSQLADLELLIHLSIEQARTTHKDPQCHAGAVAVALAINQAMCYAPPLTNPQSFISSLLSPVQSIHPPFAKSLSHLSHFINLPPSLASKAIIAELISSSTSTDFISYGEGIPGHTLSTVLWALYCFLRHPNDFCAVLRDCLSAGGDTDSTCAIAGALSGAHLGLDAIPKSLVEILQDQEKEEWNASGLCDLIKNASAAVRSAELKEMKKD